MPGLDATQFRAYIVEPVLAALSPEIADTAAARVLVLGTAIYESGGLRYLDQLGGGDGPAYGLYQMEQLTHDDLLTHFLPRHPALATKIERMTAVWPFSRMAQLRTNLAYATAMCRVQYYRAAPPLPAADDLLALGAYYKRFYNTAAGKATAEQWVANYRSARGLT